MYIIEKIIKALFKLKPERVQYQTPFQNDEVELEDVVSCNHNFLPIDSTGNILACSKCGYLTTKNKLTKQKNFFVDKN